MNRLIAPAALFALAAPAFGQDETAPFDMSPETPALAAAAVPEGPRASRAEAPAARRYILPAARLRMEGEYASRSWQVWLTPAEAAEAKVQIAYRSAILVAPEASRLRLSVNGVKLADDPVKAPERPAEISAVIPAGVLKPGPNVFTLETEQRHRTDCTPESTYELWTEFDAGRSFLSFSRPGATRLGALEDIRAVGVGPTGATRVAILAPDLAAPEVEARALGIAQALALASAMPNTSFTIAAEADDAFRAAELKVVLGDAGAIGSFTGKGDFVQSPEFGPVLAVEGSAAEMARIAALAAPGDPAAPVVNTAAWRLPDPPMITGPARIPLADLGAPTREFAGRRASVEFQVALPADFYASAYGEARLLLDAAYSAKVLPGSRIDVLVNGQLASTLPITSAGGAILRHLPIDVTMRHLRPGPNLIRIEAVTRTAADVACLPGASAAGEPRLALFGTSEFVMPAFARIGRRPDLAATAGMGYPFAGGEPPAALVLKGDRPAALSAAATVLGKIAQAAGAPAPFRLAEAATGGDAMIVGPAPAIAAETFALLGVEAGALVDWRPQPEGETAPAADQPSLDAWRGAINRGFWMRPIEAVARGFSDDAGAIGDSFGAVAPFAPATGASFLIAQGLNAAGDGSLTLVTAPTPDLLRRGAADATREELWAQVAGRATAIDASSGAVDIAPALGAELVPTQPWSLQNLRLIGANWMSSNTLVFAAALTAGCILLGLATAGLLAKLGRRG